MAGQVLTAAIALFFLWMVFIYNRLVRLRNDVKSAWSQIDVQLKRRHDLIPNLVAAVKGYMQFERDTLERVVTARAQAIAAEGLREKAVSEGRLTDAVGRLFAVMESYPVLKSSENVMQLQEELVSTENRISFARQFYNDLVANFRTRLEVFPDNIIASLFSFQGAEYFSAGEEDKALPPAGLGVRRKD
ncbi:MAG: LemA family protein [Acidobacteriota bacterium]